MFPNPHDALPLPPQPNLEQYKKRAKELAKLASSDDPNALHTWIRKWLTTLGRLADLDSTNPFQAAAEQWITAFASFAQDQKSAGTLPLAKAQFVLARAHGFDSWPKFSKHLEALARASSAEAAFETAVDSIAAGDLDMLASLLRQNPELVRTRSTRQHNATLLHYVAANGVENYRQKTPKNAVQITRVLLDSGADVNAEANVSGVGVSTLELVATSVHPERTGVQQALLQLLLDRGATDAARDGRNIISACLANGRLRAAEFLAQHEFPLDLEAAAGLGRITSVKDFLENAHAATADQKLRALCWACEYGRMPVVQLLLQHRVPLDQKVSGQTPLHWAVIGGNLETIQLLISHGADLEAKNAYGGTAVGQALWSCVHADEGIDYIPVIKSLISVGARAPENAAAWLTDRGVSQKKMQQVLNALASD